MPSAPEQDQIDPSVRQALEEDLKTGDLTADLVPSQTEMSTRVIVREDAVLSGQPWFDTVFRQLDRNISIHWHAQDGAAMTANSVVCELSGNARAILSGERTALNFLQTLSGTATQTRAFVDCVSHLPVKILDTRKTIPGLRLAQKYAVLCGGGHNHRYGLYDAILIKENHISAAGGIVPAVQRAQELHPNVLLEVEAENLDQLSQAIAAGADRALLDNFELTQLRKAVNLTDGRISLEASGNVTEETVRSIAETGVDFISTGAITKHVRAIDYSMRFFSS